MTPQPRTDTPDSSGARRPPQPTPGQRVVNAARIARLRPDVAARLRRFYRI